MRSNLLLCSLLVSSACSGRSETESPATGAASATVPAPVIVAPATPLPVPTPVLAGGGVDPCLFGTWRLTPEHAREFYGAMMSASGAPVEIVSIDGVGTATMTPSGDTTLDMGNLRVVYRTTGEGAPPMEMTMSLSGTGHADFTTDHGTITYSNSTNQFTGSMTLSIAGRTRTMPWNAAVGDSMAGPIRGQQTYRCSANELVLTMPQMPVPVTWIR